MIMIDELINLERAVDFVKRKLKDFTPRIGIILGSGLGDLANQITDAVEVDYKDIPCFPISTVAGHAGKFVAGYFQDQPVIMMQGRFHAYEGYTMKLVAMPVYVMKLLGVQSLIVTNAAGGMNRAFRAGDLMLIRDHINFTGDNPLIGYHHAQLGVRFPDMSQAYHPNLRTIAHEVAKSMRDNNGQPLSLQEGVYVGITGPAYLTSAELKMLHRVGGDALGMSTVAEVIAARHAGLDVLGISCITDLAIGDHTEPLTHEQVMAIANQTKPNFENLVKGIISRLAVVDG